MSTFSLSPTLPLEHQRRIYSTAFSQPQQEQIPPPSQLTMSISTFHLFPTLPYELRAQIWTATLPTARHISFSNPSGRLITATSPHSEIGALWTCRESRHAALRLYRGWNPRVGFFSFEEGGRLLFPPSVEVSDIAGARNHARGGKNEGFVFVSLSTDLFCFASFEDLKIWMSLTPYARELLEGARNLVFREWEIVPVREDLRLAEVINPRRGRCRRFLQRVRRGFGVVCGTRRWRGKCGGVRRNHA